MELSLLVWPPVRKWVFGRQVPLSNNGYGSGNPASDWHNLAGTAAAGSKSLAAEEENNAKAANGAPGSTKSVLAIHTGCEGDEPSRPSKYQ